jgi:hypothetical protein
MNRRLFGFLIAVTLSFTGGCSRVTTEKIFHSDSYIRGEQAHLTFYYANVEGKSNTATSPNIYNRVLYKFPVDSNSHRIGVKGAWVFAGQSNFDWANAGFTMTDIKGKYVREYRGGYGAFTEEYDGFYYVTIYTKGIKANAEMKIVVDTSELPFPVTSDLVQKQLGEPSYRTEHKQR